MKPRARFTPPPFHDFSSLKEHERRHLELLSEVPIDQLPQFELAEMNTLLGKATTNVLGRGAWGRNTSFARLPGAALGKGAR